VSEDNSNREQRACVLCFFWSSPSDDFVGQCRVKAPIGHGQLFVSRAKFNSEDAFWPVTKHDDWCGEFVPHPNKGGDSP
jgi:hypothetical protein